MNQTPIPARPVRLARLVLHLSVTSDRKAAYVRAARPRKLTAWAVEHLDKAAGYLAKDEIMNTKELTPRPWRWQFIVSAGQWLLIGADDMPVFVNPPPNVPPTDDMKHITTAANNHTWMLAELQKHWLEGECYCLPRNEGGNGSPCAHCTTGDLLRSQLGWAGEITETLRREGFRPKRP